MLKLIFMTFHDLSHFGLVEIFYRLTKRESLCFYYFALNHHIVYCK